MHSVVRGPPTFCIRTHVRNSPSLEVRFIREIRQPVACVIEGQYVLLCTQQLLAPLKARKSAIHPLANY